MFPPMARRVLIRVASIMAIATSLACAAPVALVALPLRPGARSAPAARGAASKRCGVASDEAVFEAPGVQVYFKQLGLNKRVGYRQQSLIARSSPDAVFFEERLLDLQTGRSILQAAGGGIP
jgi:hypothetical protein